MLQKLSEEIIPLSRRQNLVLLIIITCVFQFVLFYAPALADEAVSRAKAENEEPNALIANDFIIKDPAMDTEASTLVGPLELIGNLKTSSNSETTVKVLRTSTHVITAYNSEAAQTDSSPCITANGFNVCEHGEEDTIAANFLKFGTKVKIPELFGDRVFTVRDRMNKRHADRVDVWMKEKSDALNFGIKVAKIEVIEVIE